MAEISRHSSSGSSGKVHTINSIGMGRLHGKNAIVTGAAGYVILSAFSPAIVGDSEFGEHCNMLTL